tara:strand:+ start:5307 stop:6416 length:1110 start_codon:yes stop_codon:yes gene_type:complete
LVAVISCSHFPDDERIYHREINALHKENYVIKYFTLSDIKINLSRPGINHKNYDLSKVSLDRYLGYVEKDLIKDPPEIIHIHEPELFLIAIKMKKLFSTKIVYDVHEDYISMINTFSRLKWPLKTLKIKYWEYNEKKFLKYVDEIFIASPTIVNSNFVSQGFNPILLENFPLKKFVEKIEINSKIKNSIIYHGNLGPERGISDLIKAISIVVSKIPDANLSIYGSYRISSYEGELMQLITSLELKNNITINGHIEHKNIWRYLRKHEVGVIPFRNNPLTSLNTPTKIFEYMACGCKIVSASLKPILRYDIKGVDFFKPGDVNGLANSIIKSLKSVKPDSLNYNQNKILNTYCWELNKSKIIGTYKKIMK